MYGFSRQLSSITCTADDGTETTQCCGCEPNRALSYVKHETKHCINLPLSVILSLCGFTHHRLASMWPCSVV